MILVPLFDSKFLCYCCRNFKSAALGRCGKIPVFFVPRKGIRFPAMRFLSQSSTLICLALLAAPALAETTNPEPVKPVESPRAARADRTQALDRLFEALK